MPIIITIDDEKDFTDMIENYFAVRGYEVLVANDGESGLAMIRDAQPDVALIDLKMPGKRGDEILVQLKRVSPKTIPIMITACESEDAVRERLLELGAVEVFDKPLQSIKNLEAKIKEVLGNK